MRKEQEQDLGNWSSSLKWTENVKGQVLYKSSAPFPSSRWAFWPDEEDEDDQDILTANAEMEFGSYAVYLAAKHGKHD